jgi:hypothetical protein
MRALSEYNKAEEKFKNAEQMYKAFLKILSNKNTNIQLN